MPIERVRENSTCHNCGTSDIQTKPSKYFSTDTESFSVSGGEIWLCAKCKETDNKARLIKCHKCNEFVWSKGGLRKLNGKKYCQLCFVEMHEEQDRKRKRNQKITKYIIKYGKITLAILTGLATLTVIIQYVQSLD